MANQPDRPDDFEHALHLLNPKYFKNGQVKANAFREKPPGDPRRRGKSMFMEERLPEGDGKCLHKGQFETWSRARLLAEVIRSVSYDEDGQHFSNVFDLEMTPEGAINDLAPYAAAHADLIGATHIDAATVNLAARFNAAKDFHLPPAYSNSGEPELTG